MSALPVHQHNFARRVFRHPSRPLPATGLPKAREKRRGSAVLSALLHAAIIALLIRPLTSDDVHLIERNQGAGGKGPAGGGGGGNRGSGAERIQYIRPAPPPTPVTPPPVAVVPPPVIPPPEAKPLELTMPKLATTAEAPIAVSATTVGVGGGTGNDGSGGSGPGRGGGVGTGVGTGRGSGVGPGTGGGMLANYSPSPIELFIPPLPMPAKVRGFHLIAEYDIDETGKIVGDVVFTPTPDRDYNNRLKEVLKSFRFRPGTRPDGTPIRMKAQIIYDF